MEYAVGKPGRVIALRLFEGEDLYACVEEVARKENVRCAAVFITGGIRKADVVVGPATEQPRIIPKHKDFQGPGEVLGVGTIYHDGDNPTLHIHTAMGRGDNYIVGCPRGGAEVFLILEVTLIEFEGIDAIRKLDEDTGFKLLSLTKQK